MQLLQANHEAIVIVKSPVKTHKKGTTRLDRKLEPNRKLVPDHFSSILCAALVVVVHSKGTGRGGIRQAEGACVFGNGHTWSPFLTQTPPCAPQIACYGVHNQQRSLQLHPNHIKGWAHPMFWAWCFHHDSWFEYAASHPCIPSKECNAQFTCH
jgi:hypothetical protein